VSRLRKLLDRDVEVWIGYGAPTSGPASSDREAEDRLGRVARDYPSLCRVARFDDVRTGALICDSRFAVLAAFNWLAFRGDVQLQFRDERGFFIGVGDAIDERFESYLVRFEERQA
jgi:hypothetical protein